MLMTYLDKIYTLYLLKNIHILVFLSLFIGLNTSLTAATSYGLYSLGIEDSEYSYDLENGRNLPLALELARASSLAYENFLWESDREFFADNGFESSNIKFFNFPLPASIAGIRPYLRGVTLSKQVTIDGINKKLVIISFKGTSHLPDYVADAVAYPSKFQENETIKVHSGFHAFFKVARANEANISIDTDTLDNAINDPKTIFVITGHSLGGAIAKLYGASLRERGIDENRLLVYTYGAPPVGFGDENSFEARYNPYSGDKAVRIRDAANQLDPVYHLAYIKLPKLPILTHSGTLYMPFNRYGNLKSIDSGCNLAEFLSIIPGGKILANANNFDNKPLCDLTFSAHKLGGYIKNLYNHIDFSELSNNLIAEGLAGITFDEHELLVLETIVTNPRYQKAISGQTFDATQLTDEDRKQLLQDIKATGVPISSKNFGNLGVKILASIKDAVDSKKDAIEQAKNEINSNQELHFDEYKKLAFGSAINVVTGVSDILTLGSSSLAIKMPKLTAASGKLANIVSKTTPLMTKAIKITETKKFIFLKALIESNFVVTDNIKGMIDRDAATGDLVSNIIGVGGDLSKSTLTAKMDNTTKGKFAAAFVGLLNDVVTKMIQEGTKSLIEDKEVRDTIDEFLSAVTELIPIAGPYFAQWHLGKKVSEDIDNKPEVKQAWANFNNLYDQIFAQLDAVGEVGFKKRLDVIMNSALKQIKEKHVALQESEEEPQAGAFFILPSTATLQDYVISATVGDEIKLIPTDEAPYLMEHIKEAIDSSQPLVLWYYDVTSQTRKSIPLTIDNYNGGNFFVLHFTAPSAQFQPVSIAYDRNGDSQYTINVDLPILWSTIHSNSSVELDPPNPCPTESTDIACIVGIHIVRSIENIRANNVTISGKYAYVAGSDGLKIYDVTLPSSPRFIANFNGEYNDVKIHNSYAYAVGGYYGSLKIINISNLDNPTLVGSVSLGRSTAEDIQIKGNFAFVAGNTGLKVINISNPSSPSLTSELESNIDEQGRKVILKDNYAFLTNGDRGIIVIDITDPSNPTYVRTFGNNGSTKAIDISGNYLYSANAYWGIGGSHLTIFDISDPGSPITMGSITTRYSQDVKVVGDYAYVADGVAGLSIINISEASDPVLQANIRTQYATGIHVQGKYVYIADNTSMKVIDISNPLNNSQSHSMTDSRYSLNFSVENGHIYTTNGLNGLQIYDISNRQDITLIASTSNRNIVYKEMIKVGNYVYISFRGYQEGEGLIVIDVSNPINPDFKSILYTHSSYRYGYTKLLHVDSKYATLIDKNGMKTVDISDPENPTIISSINIENISAKRIQIQGNYAYIADSNGLKIINLISQETVGSIDYTFNIIDFQVLDGLAYIASKQIIDNQKQITIINITNPLNPEVASTLELDDSILDTITLQNDYIFLDRGHVLQAVNVLDPINPFVADSVGIKGFSDLKIQGDFLFITDSNGLSIYDISNSTSLQLKGVITANNAANIEVQGDTAYFYEGSLGIKVIEWKQSISNYQLIENFYNPVTHVNLVGELPVDYHVNRSTFTKQWFFNKDISDFDIKVVSNSYDNHINSSDIRRDGNSLSVTLTTDRSQPTNKLELEFTKNNNIVLVNGSDTFWSLTKTNNAPRLADGQSTQLVSLTSEPAYLQINTYDADNDAVILSIEDDAGGYVGFDPQDPNNLFASFSDGKTHHTIKVGLNDGKEKVIYSFDVNQFNSSNIQTYYTDVDPNSNQYPFSGIALGTLMGVISGQLDPNDLTKKIFKPLDKASLAETLKIIINSASTAGLIQVHPANEYIQTYPTWAMPYYTYARDRGAVDVINNNISAVYPTREQVAKLVVKILGLDEKLLEFTNINVSFSDEAEFSNEAMKRYAQIVHFFGLFMTEETANPQQTINRAELALIIEKIFMTPTATDITFNPVNIEYGTSFIASLIGVKAQAIGSSFMPYDNSANIQAAFLSNTQVLPSPIDSNKLLTGINTLYAVINNNGVKNIISRPLTINFTDTDSDGIKDSVDLWVDDGRYAYDSNQNGIPDVLDNLLGLTIYTLNDDIKVEGGTIQIRDIINYGGIREEDIQQEAANVEVIIPILQLLLGE